MERATGQFVEATASGEAVRAFVPQALPPNPPLEYNKEIHERLQQAKARLSELRVASHLVPSPDLFNYAFVRKEAIQTSQELFRLFDRDRKRMLSSPKVVVPAIRLFEELPSHPVLTINQVVKLLKTTKPTAAKAVDVLVENGILEETTGAKRNRMFGYRKYLEALKTEVK